MFFFFFSAQLYQLKVSVQDQCWSVHNSKDTLIQSMIIFDLCLVVAGLLTLDDELYSP